jgi:hypothetical protein
MGKVSKTLSQKQSTKIFQREGDVAQVIEHLSSMLKKRIAGLGGGQISEWISLWLLASSSTDLIAFVSRCCCGFCEKHRSVTFTHGTGSLGKLLGGQVPRAIRRRRESWLSNEHAGSMKRDPHTHSVF